MRDKLAREATGMEIASALSLRCARNACNKEAPTWFFLSAHSAALGGGLRCKEGRDDVRSLIGVDGGPKSK